MLNLKPDTEKKCLVRGYVVYSQWREGLIGVDVAKDDNHPNVGIAYTLWHRHDENPDAVEHELNQLYNVYSRFLDCDAMMLGYEYRDYKHN